MFAVGAAFYVITLFLFINARARLYLAEVRIRRSTTELENEMDIMVDEQEKYKSALAYERDQVKHLQLERDALMIERDELKHLNGQLDKVIAQLEIEHKRHEAAEQEKKMVRAETVSDQDANEVPQQEVEARGGPELANENDNALALEDQVQVPKEASFVNIAVPASDAVVSVPKSAQADANPTHISAARSNRRFSRTQRALRTKTRTRIASKQISGVAGVSKVSSPVADLTAHATVKKDNTELEGYDQLSKLH